MKDLRSTRPCQLIALLAILVILFSSCEKDEDATPDYVGEWMTIKTVPGHETAPYVRQYHYLTLSMNTFSENYLQRYDLYSSRYILLTGSISISGDVLSLVIKEINYSNYDSHTNSPSNPYLTVEKGDSNFNSTLGFAGKRESYTYEYRISGNEMTLKMDFNNDGDYSDNNETVVYTRQD